MDYQTFVKRINEQLKEEEKERRYLQDAINAHFKNATFRVVKDMHKTPYSTTGTNFKGRLCRMGFIVEPREIICFPVFQNLRTKNFDIKIDYGYSPDNFEFVENNEV